ncbi:10738_t:CDS:2 [Paraglomus brasilianum]|uniref:10738_t:CDS:1 n=1 Tax=Paraglomus brasilianum TaxID=144538 RepID=A0A9N9ADL4_9GLOM|nr:10738_t:CDS:2 [Paraglomus brasilianum]
MSDYNIDAEERGVHTETRNGNSDEPESEYEDEVSYLILDVGTELTNEMLQSLDHNQGYSLIGLDTDTPYLEVAGQQYRGELDDQVGTTLLFTQELDPDSSRCSDLNYICHTSKRINFSRIILEHKKPEESTRNVNSQEEADEGRTDNDESEWDFEDGDVNVDGGTERENRRRERVVRMEVDDASESDV